VFVKSLRMPSSYRKNQEKRTALRKQRAGANVPDNPGPG